MTKFKSQKWIAWRMLNLFMGFFSNETRIIFAIYFQINFCGWKKKWYFNLYSPYLFRAVLGLRLWLLPFWFLLIVSVDLESSLSDGFACWLEISSGSFKRRWYPELFSTDGEEEELSSSCPDFLFVVTYLLLADLILRRRASVPNR